MLRAKIGVASEDECASWKILAKAVVEGRSVEERVRVEELRARADVKVASVWREIRLSLVGPEGVETFADVVLFDDAPVPLCGVRVSCVDV